MEKLILTLHIIVCVVLVILVLLQSGKEGMGVIFGGGSSSLFGSTGAGGILVKLTTFIAVIFLATSLGYNIVTSAGTTRHSTVIDIPIDDPSAPAAPMAPANATSPANATMPATTGNAASPSDAPKVLDTQESPAARPSSESGSATPPAAAAPSSSGNTTMQPETPAKSMDSSMDSMDAGSSTGAADTQPAGNSNATQSNS